MQKQISQKSISAIINLLKVLYLIYLHTRFTCYSFHQQQQMFMTFLKKRSNKKFNLVQQKSYFVVYCFRILNVALSSSFRGNNFAIAKESNVIIFSKKSSRSSFEDITLSSWRFIKMKRNLEINKYFYVF